MGKHDEQAHKLHISKRAKFDAPKPNQAALSQHNLPPQANMTKTNSQNNYRGHGRGQ